MIIFLFLFDIGEPLQGRALRTHPRRVNLGPMHHTLESYLNDNLARHDSTYFSLTPTSP